MCNSTHSGVRMKAKYTALATGVFFAAFLAAPLRSDNSQGNQNQNNQDQKPDGRGDRTRQSPPRSGASVPSGNGISFHGGAVMMGTTNIYYIFYGTWTDANIAMLIKFATNIGGSPYFNINTSYTDGTGTAIPNSVNFVLSTTDAYSRGTALSDGDIQ